MGVRFQSQKHIEEMSGLGIFCLFSLLVGLFSVLQIGHGIEASYDSHHNLRFLTEDQPYRTAYHFQPQRNWMNDPNGPMYYKGLYHLFYQFNPNGPLWNQSIVWGHSISYNLIDWFHLNTAFSPSEPFDINGCWSGSATILPNEKPVILYTGIDSQSREVQNLIVPKNLSDPLLREWQKYPQNPIMTPFKGIDVRSFRDPSTAWKGPDDTWHVTIGTQIDGLGIAVLYKSQDFFNWTKSENPLHSTPKTGMWECVDFYPVRTNSTKGIDTSDMNEFNKHVLKESSNSHDYYILGKYQHETDKFVVDTDFGEGNPDLRYDYGKFYASKTFYDSGKNRRILWGWVNESDSESDAYVKGWSGLQTVPRSIILSKSGRQLILWPIKETKQLHGEKVSVYDKELKGGSLFKISGITASQADVEVSFDTLNLEKAELMDPSWVDPQLLCSQKAPSINGKIGPFGLLVLASKNLEEQTAVFFRVFKNGGKYVVLMCSDQSRSSLREEGLDKTTFGAFVDIDPLHEKITLRSLIDHSIIESFGGKGRSCITARVYPKLAIDGEALLYAFNNGSESVKITKLNAWNMKRAQLVPLNEGTLVDTGEY